MENKESGMCRSDPVYINSAQQHNLQKAIDLFDIGMLNLKMLWSDTDLADN